MNDVCFKVCFQVCFQPVRGQPENIGKPDRVLFCGAQTPGLHFSASVREYSYEQTVWFVQKVGF